MTATIHSRDIFYRLRTELAGAELIALVAYALFEKSRYEWIEGREQDGKTPSDEENRNWIRDQNLEPFVVSARSFLAVDRLENRITKIDENVGEVLRSTKALQREWPVFLLGVGSGLVSTLLFTALVFLGWLIFQTDPSPFGLLKHALKL